MLHATFGYMLHATCYRVSQKKYPDFFNNDSFSNQVGHEVTQCEKNPNSYFLGAYLPYSFNRNFLPKY